VSKDPWSAVRGGVDEDGAARLRKLAARQAELEEEHAKKVAEAKAKERELNEVRDRLIPDLLDELGFGGGATDVVVGGWKVELKNELRLSVPKGKMLEACDWFEQHDLGGIVKRHVYANFVVGEEEEAAEALAALQRLRPQAALDRRIESGTMKKTIKELLASGEDVPLELFGAYHQRRAKVTRKGD